MKNFIRFLEAELNADFKNIIFFVFWALFDSEINFSSNVDQKTRKILFDF